MMINISQTPGNSKKQQRNFSFKSFSTNSNTNALSRAFPCSLSLSCSLFSYTRPSYFLSFSHTLAFATPCKGSEKARSRNTLSGNTIR